MNYFNRNRFLIITLVILLIISVTGLATVVFSNRSDKNEKSATCSNSVEFLTKELNLTKEQQDKISQIKSSCMSNSGCMIRELRKNNKILIHELAAGETDSLKIDSLKEQIIQQQKIILDATIQQYMAIKSVCTPEQQEKLSELYFELFGCGNRGKEKKECEMKGCN